MAKIEIKHNPHLTKENLMELFREHFNGKYEVYMTKTIGNDFVVKKSRMAGVFLKLKQKGQKTQILYTRAAPSAIFRALFLLPVFLASRDVQKDVKTFLETAPEFKSQ